MGLADQNVYVLDPCCGIGAYPLEVLRQIERTLRAKDDDALMAHDLKQAAMHRVFGFEILPAPFVIAHLQLGLLLQSTGAALEEGERAGIFLTNALTGWSEAEAQTRLPIPEFQDERDQADHVKREAPILVILGNPPYNAYAGFAQSEEEKDLIQPYKEGLINEWGIKKFNLDELYVRFFRLAERRIAEQSSRGVVCFISNYSWLEGPSFVVLRKHLLESYDRFWIENMHGDRKISEYAPDGKTSETIFAIAGFSPGIQQGVGVSLWVKNNMGYPTQVLFRDDLDQAKAEERRAALIASLNNPDFNDYYMAARPSQLNRFSFRPQEVSADYLSWPKVVDLCAEPPSNGLMEKRGGALMDIDRAALETRMKMYYDRLVSWNDLRGLDSGLTKDAAGFEAERVRGKVQNSEIFTNERLRRYSYAHLTHVGVITVW